MWGWKKRKADQEARDKRHDDLDEKFRSELSELYIYARTGRLSPEDRRKVLARVEELEKGLQRKKLECSIKGLKA